jgi:glycosyltransferase involved in cell wall biosynthesis
LPIDIVLVGGGVSKSDLRWSAESNGLHNVRFLDPVPKTQIPNLLCAADLGLHVLADVELFRYGISPNKIFDYMAAGLPVLTNTPGLAAEMVESSGGGIAVDPDDLARGLTEFWCMSEADRAKMGRQGKEWVEVNHSRTVMAERLQGLLDRLA